MNHGLLKKLIFSCLVVLSISVAAQQDSMGNSKSLPATPRFYSLTNVGFLAGSSGRDLQLQTLAGVQMSRWSVALGAGVDYYYLRSVPLFLDVRRQIFKTVPFFIYADAGWHLPWIKKSNQQTDLYTSSYNNGSYYDVGAAWKFQMQKQKSLVFSLGYSSKRLTEVQKATFIPPDVNEAYYTTNYRYNLQRISIKAGFQF